MKLNRTCTWILLAIVSLTACQQKETYTILSGRLPDFQNQTLTLIPLDDFFPGFEPTGKNLLTAQSDSLGNFTFRSDKIKPGFYQVMQRNYARLDYDIYIEQGDSLFIEQAWEPNTFKVTGKGSEKLQHLVRDHNIFPEDRKFGDTIRSAGFQTELVFKAFIDSIYDGRIATVKDDKTTPELLKSHFINGVLADKASTLLYHLERRNYNMFEEMTYAYPDTSYYSFLNDIKFDDAFCSNSNAKSLASDYLTNKTRLAFKNKDEEAWWKEQLTWRMNYVTNQPPSTWNDLLSLSIIREFAFGMFNDDFFPQVTAFDQKAKNLFSKPANLDMYRQNALSFLNLAPGKPAPDFALPDSSGKILKLSDYKGKIVYMDVWGTWCGPCIAEIPDALKLQEAYKDKPVVFLYVALESDKNDIDNWRNFIAGKNKQILDKPFTGVHLVAENQMGNKEIRPYKINFAPTHVLIDHNGNIVKARADGPKEIAKDIDALLEKM